MKHFIGTTLNYFTHTRARVCVCGCGCECECSRKRATRGMNARSIVSRRTCRKLPGILRSCLHSSGCCCRCSHIAHTHHRTVALRCFDAVSLVRPSQSQSESESESESESSSIAIFDFLIILKAMSVVCWLHRRLLCVWVCVCVWVGVCVVMLKL